MPNLTAADSASAPFIMTFSGQRFYFGDHAAMVKSINIEDIAHALSQLCRFTGHSKFFYSVAEHSVHVSRLVPEEYALAALLHDATEAYCADLSSPLKSLVPAYKRLEAGVWKAVAETFDLPERLPAEVKLADLQMLKVESEQVFLFKLRPDTFNAAVSLPARGLELEYWTPWDAKGRFLERFRDLTKKRTKG